MTNPPAKDAQREEENPFAKYVQQQEEVNPFAQYIQQPEEENPFAKYVKQPEAIVEKPVEQPVAQPAPVVPFVPPEQIVAKKKEEEKHWYDFLNEEATARQKLATDVGSDVFTASKNTPTAFLAAAAALAEGNDNQVIFGEKDWKDKEIENARSRIKEAADEPGAQEEYILGITREKLRNLPNNLAYSLLSMGTGLAAAVPAFFAGSLATPVVGTVSAYGSGAAASGVAAYRMDTNGFIRDIREQLDKASEEVTGKPLTDEQFLKIAPNYEKLVREHGLWEALPEALGNVLGAGVGKSIFKAASPGIRGLIETTAKTGAVFVNELGTETVTKIGQHNVAREAGLTDEPERSFTNFEDVKKSAEEVLPDVLLLTGVLAGGAKATGAASRAFNTPERQFANAFEKDVAERNYSREGIEARANQALNPNLNPEDVAARRQEEERPVRAEETKITPSDEEQVVGFTTAKGSTYSINPDGTTVRDKKARAEQPGEEGIQPPSLRTVYVTPEQADNLSLLETTGPRKTLVFDDETGQVAVKYLDGPDAGKLERRTITPFSTQPAVGLMPVEYWGDNKTVHFGNKITEVQTQPLEQANVITPTEAQQTEAQGTQQAAAAPAIEPTTTEQTTTETGLPTKATEATQEYFNPLEADSYAELTDMLGLPEDATEGEVMERADYLGHDAIVYNSPKGKVSFALEDPSEGESKYFNIAPDTPPAAPPVAPVVPPVEPVVEQQRRRLPSLKRALDRLRRLLDSGAITTEEHSQAVIAERELDQTRQSNKPVNPRARGARHIRRRILQAVNEGDISEDEADLAEWFIMQNPALLEDLGVSIRAPGKNNVGTAGEYNPLARIIALFKHAQMNGTIIHEILHHMERMMPSAVQDAIGRAWRNKFNAAQKKANKGTSQALKDFFTLLDGYHSGRRNRYSNAQMQAAMDMLISGEVPYDNYQYVNPSEFWAVNATSIMQNRYEFSNSVMGRLRNWLREFTQKVKGLFGFPSEAPIIKALNSLMRGDGAFVSSTMLYDRGGYANISPNASNEAKTALTELNDNGMGMTPEDPKDKQGMFSSIRNAIDNPALTAESAKKAYSRFLNRVEGALFTSDAPLNNDIRQALKDSGKNVEEILGALLEISLSQAVHADAMASNLLQYGKLTYNKALHKWEAIQVEDNFLSLAKQIDALSKKHNITTEEAQAIGHRAFEARRTKSLANFADEMRQEARSSFNQANKAKKASVAAEQAGDQKAAAELLTQSRKFAKEAQRFYRQAPYIHLKPAQVKIGMELFNKFPELNKMSDTWQEMRKNAKDMMLESGLWSEEYAEQLLSNIDYVPFQRVEKLEESQSPRQIIRGLQVQAKEKRLKGSERAVNNVFDNMAKWMQYAANRSIRNRSAIALVDAAVDMGLAKEIDAKDKGEKNVTRVWKDGEETFYQMDDPLYMDAFKGLETIAIPVIKAFAATSNFVRDFIVLNPLFTAGQAVIMDPYVAMFTSGIKTRHALLIPARAVKELVLTLAKKSKTHEELRKFGVVGVKDFQSAVARLDAEIAAGIKAPPGFWGKVKSGLQHIAMAGDNAVRQAVYEASIASGKSEAESLEKAFQIINFRTRGTSKILQIGAQTIPFMNAYFAVQHVAYKTLSGRGISPEQRLEAAKTLAATSGSVMALSVIYTILNADDEDYLKKPAATRDRLLMIPGSGGLSIPLRKDFFLFPKIIAEHSYLLLTDKGYEDPRKFRDSMTATLVNSILSPTPVPQAIKAPVEIKYNHDFFQDRPLIPANMQNLATERKFNDATSAFGKLLGKTGIMAPINIDHMVKGYLGSVGVAFLGLTNAFAQLFTDTPRPSLTFQEVINSIPGTSGFLSKPTESALKNDFYVLMEECNKAANTLTDVEKRTPHELEDMTKDETLMVRANMAPEINKIAEELAEIRKNITFIRNAPEKDYTASEKQKEIKELQALEEAALKSMDIKNLRKMADL